MTWTDKGQRMVGPIRLTDLAALSFVISLAFMAFEMAAGRLASRHLGSSIYGWTSIIGVLLGGLSLGNFLGGKLANYFKSVSQASWLFVAASLLILLVSCSNRRPAGWCRTRSRRISSTSPRNR